MQKAILSWSGGKDSALALHEIQQAGDHEITALLTTITEDYDRSSMHGIRRVLIEQQAGSLGIPLEKVLLSPVSSNEEYDSRMRELLERHKREGVSTVVFGDIYPGGRPEIQGRETRIGRDEGRLSLVGKRHDRACPHLHRSSGSRRSSPAWIPSSWTEATREGPSTRTCSLLCLQAWTPAERTASSTPLCTTDRSSNAPSLTGQGRSSCGMNASCLRT